RPPRAGAGLRPLLQHHHPGTGQAGARAARTHLHRAGPVLPGERGDQGRRRPGRQVLLAQASGGGRDVRRAAHRVPVGAARRQTRRAGAARRRRALGRAARGGPVSGQAVRARRAWPPRPLTGILGPGETGWAWLFALPAVALIGGFVLYPVLNTILFSFTDFNGLAPARFTGLDQYAALAGDSVFHRTLLNSALITAAAIVLLVCLPLPVAYWIHRGIPFRRFFRAVLYLPVVVPIIVSSVAWKWMLDEAGLLNYLLTTTGITDRPVSWLSDPGLAIWTVTGVIVWRAFGIYLLIYLAGLSTMPDDQLEAAAIDGAGHARTL